MKSDVRFENVAEGQEIPSLVRRMTNVTNYLYGVALWAPHRIHYDREWARSEGYDDVVIIAGLMSSYLSQMLVRWAGDPGSLRKLELTNRAPAYAGDTVTSRAVVRRKYRDGEETFVECDVEVEKQDGTKVVTGTAVVRLP